MPINASSSESRTSRGNRERELLGDRALDWFVSRYRAGSEALDALLTSTSDVFGGQVQEQLVYRASYDVDLGQPRQLVVELPYAIDDDLAWASIERVFTEVGEHWSTNPRSMEPLNRNRFLRAIARIALIPNLPPKNITSVLSRAQTIAESE